MGNEVLTARIYELSSEKRITGRRKFKAVLHEIFQSREQYQINGISWDETYTSNSLDSIPGMSICVEFISEDRRLPYNHGLTGIRDGDNTPLLEDATMVGCFERGYITDIEIEGVMKRVLVAEGTIDEMRYPKFVAWLEEELKSGVVKGSVEIVGHPENDNRIIYDGGWKEKGRVPQVYDYSGYAILGVKPADDSAIVIELNNKMDKKEEIQMDEKILSQFTDTVQTAISNSVSELNSKWDEYYAKVQTKEAEIAQLNANIAEKEAEIAQLRADYEAAQAKAAAAEAGLVEVNAKVAELEKDKKIAELNAALNDFSADEQALAASEIEAFKADPMSVEINSITDKICREMVRMNKEAVKAEQNSAAPDIFGWMCEPKNTENDDIF